MNPLISLVTQAVSLPLHLSLSIFPSPSLSLLCTYTLAVSTANQNIQNEILFFSVSLRFISCGNKIYKVVRKRWLSQYVQVEDHRGRWRRSRWFSCATLSFTAPLLKGLGRKDLKSEAYDLGLDERHDLGLETYWELQSNALVLLWTSAVSKEKLWWG